MSVYWFILLDVVVQISVYWFILLGVVQISVYWFILLGVVQISVYWFILLGVVQISVYWFILLGVAVQNAVIRQQDSPPRHRAGGPDDGAKTGGGENQIRLLP